jgi:ADP-heptose:LPS heptosyltransferase
MAVGIAKTRQTSPSGSREGPLIVYRIGQLGDAIVSLPAIAELRRQNPGRRLVLLTDRHPKRTELVSSWDVLGALGFCDDVLRYDVCDNNVVANWVAYFKLARTIRAIAPYEIVNLAPRTRHHQVWRDRLFFQRLCGVSRYRWLPPAANGSPSGPEWLRLLQVINAAATPSFAFRITVPKSAEYEAATALAPVSTALHLVAFSPGSKMPSKRWPIERYTEVGKQILNEYPGTAIVILGGPEDRAVGDQLQQAWGARAANLCGLLSILGSAAVLARCTAYVGNDTGAMHLAGLVGTRCVALFSARDVPGKWVPLGTRHHVLRKTVPCAGCMLEVCDKNNLCLTKISIDEVVSAWHAVASDHPTLSAVRQ